LMTASPSADRIRQMSAVAANFNGLRGLLVVPAGIWLLAMGASYVLAPGLQDWVLASVVLAFAAMVMITRRYRDRFGQVRNGQSAVQWAVGAAAIVMFMLSGIPVNLAAGTPIWPYGLQAVLVMVFMVLLPPLIRGRGADLALSRHWQVMCAIVAAASLIPVGLLTGGPHPLNADYETGYGTMLMVLGVCYIVGGLLDHRLLVRTLAATSAGPR
ncbi:MAG: hypothetical protein ACRD0P_29455, partial [Stackebrandtia sp.]